jgi:hypothetical protein
MRALHASRSVLKIYVAGAPLNDEEAIMFLCTQVDPRDPYKPL